MSSNGKTKWLAVLLSLTIAQAALSEEETCGPPNLLKTMQTPFSGSVLSQKQDQRKGNDLDAITLGEPISISSSKPKAKLTLKSKLVAPRLYLPGRMFLGLPAKFTIKGPAGSSMALAMADRDSGASPVGEYKLRLAADRKVVAVGEIPESGVLEFYIGTPIEGDLVGQYLYFEAAVWKKPDLLDTQLAQTVAVTGPQGPQNGVLVATENIVKRGVKFVPDSAVPWSQRQNTQSLSSGQP
ncbi:MAG: hypothetical protein K8F91_03135 [Candidatus Obscuribacterales bacterium]|nr:hypothetical protein [Candidatus Obscuribacterales bacterium]